MPKIDLTTTEGQIAALKSPAVNVRNSGFTRLKAQGEKAVPAVAALLDDKNPFIAMRAVWLLAQMGVEGIAKVTPLLASKDATVRLVAFRALRVADSPIRELPEGRDANGKRLLRFGTTIMDMIGIANLMAGDESAAVRREVALTMREVPLGVPPSGGLARSAPPKGGTPNTQSVEILVKLARQFDGKDRAYLEAFGLGCTGKEAEVYAAIFKELLGELQIPPRAPEHYSFVSASICDASERWGDNFAWLAWRLHPAAAVDDFKARILSPKLSLDQRKLMLTALAFVPTREAAGAMLEVAHAKDFPMKDLAMWWLLNRKGNDWKAYDVEGGMKALGIYDPDKVKLVAVEMPPAIKDAVKLPPFADIAKVGGDAKRGESAIAVCYMCHRVGTNGVDFGPDLSTFGKQQTTEILVQAIAEPSATISHGFEGSEVKTKDGLSITGMVLSSGDPLIIKCMGGLVQTVPRKRIASVTKMTQSLMYEPSQLGLTVQGIVDIVAYLKSL